MSGYGTTVFIVSRKEFWHIDSYFKRVWESSGGSSSDDLVLVEMDSDYSSGNMPIAKKEMKQCCGVLGWGKLQRDCGDHVLVFTEDIDGYTYFKGSCVAAKGITIAKLSPGEYSHGNLPVKYEEVVKWEACLAVFTF